MLRYILVAAFVATLPRSFAQSPAAGTKQEVATTANTGKTAPSDDAKPASQTNEPEKQPVKENDPFEMLEQAYYAGAQLPNDEHAYQMGRLVIVAAKMKHPMLRQWVHETLQLTQGLPQQSSRQPTEEGALSALAEIEPAEALQMLTQLAPATLAVQGTRSTPTAGRTNAARGVFPKYWKGVKAPDIQALSTAAKYLGETGQYPFAAVGLILRDVSAKDAAAAESLFLDAMQYYGREQINSVQVHIEFRQLLQAARGVLPDSMVRAGVELAVDRLLKEAATGMPSNMVYVGRVYTGTGFAELHSIAEDTLFRLLPLVRELEPGLEERIKNQITALKNPVPSDIGSLPDGYSEAAAVIVVNPDDPEERAKVIESAKENNRASTARRLASTDPEMALKIANAIEDPALRAATLMTIAQGKLNETNPERAAQLMAEAGGKEASKPEAQPKDEKAQLGVLVSLARGEAGRSGTGLWDTLNRALDLAEELFQKELQAGPHRVGYSTAPDREGPGYVAAGFEEANALIKIGMEKETVNTLGWLAKEHDPALKSYLLVSAAEGLWNEQQGKTATASATLSPRQ